MKSTETLLALAAALSLGGCASTELMKSLTPEQGAALTAEQRAANLATLKEVNRHIEMCTRTYAWPFTMAWSCPGTPAAPQALTAEQIANIAAQAARAAVTDLLDRQR